MIPVSGRVGQTSFTTSLWPKSDGYYIPLKDEVRLAENIALGDTVTVHIEVRVR